MRACTETVLPSRNNSTGTVASTSTSATPAAGRRYSSTGLPLNFWIMSPGRIAALSAG